MKFVQGMVVALVCFGLLACGQSVPEDAATAVASTTSETSPGIPSGLASLPTGNTTLSPRQAALWSNSCAQCHVDGTAFAPRVGNHEEWSQRLAKGSPALLQSTLDGLNDMPPLGYCMACERQDFIAMIDFMSAGVAAASIAEEVAHEN